MRGIRLRATVLVTLVFGAALLAGGLIVTAVLHSRLLDNLDTTLTTAATDRAALIVDGADPRSLTDTRLDETLVWIGRPDGATLAAGGHYTLAGAPDGGPGTRTAAVPLVERGSDEHHEAEDEQLRLAVAEAATPSGPVLVAVGSELEVVDGPVRDVRRVLVVGAPALLILVGALTWVTADRALRPVEAIRAGAERVRSHTPDAAVPVPRTGDEIERLAATVNDMLARLADADRRQRQFVGDASHELKSPLANLRIDIETTETDPDQRSRHLSQIDRLTTLVDDLLELARQDEGRSPRTDEVDLDDVVFDVLTAASPDRRPTIDIGGVRPTRVRGDEGELRRLVRNLVDNAVRHASSRVAVSLTSEDGAAVLRVDDDGPGVPADERDRIFERFSRADSARGRDGGGTGLGLAIVAGIAARHAGRVAVDDAPLGGARFIVTLPVDATEA